VLPEEGGEGGLITFAGGGVSAAVAVVVDDGGVSDSDLDPQDSQRSKLQVAHDKTTQSSGLLFLHKSQKVLAVPRT